MNTLAIDTCDARGSVGLRIDGRFVGVQVHGEEDYSSWLLPAAERCLALAQRDFSDVGLLAVATGPGSFTGVRIGLCAVKAWAEVYGTDVVGVSRLEALARSVQKEGWIAASYDAHRGQIFAGLYQRGPGTFERYGDELVIAPEEFLAFVRLKSAGAFVHWVSLDPNLIGELPSAEAQAAAEQSLRLSDGQLSSVIGEAGEEMAACGSFADVLELDANYVRRSDAEIFWKGPAHRGG